jgi:hypothetical protein
MGFNGNKGKALEAQMHPLVVVTPKFMQIIVPLPLSKLMVQSRLGVAKIVEVKMHLKVVATPKFIQRMAPLPPLKQMAQSH